MKVQHVNSHFSIADILNTDDFLLLRREGYTLIVNNRPDEEEGDYLLHSQEKALAEKNGMDYFYMPFTYDTLAWETVYQFHRLVSKHKKMVAHCRSGSRSIALFLLHALQEGKMNKDTFRETCRQYGTDADKALDWYRRQQQHSPVAEVHHFYEPVSGSLQYIIADVTARRCAIIDPVLDFERHSATVSHHQAQMLLDFIEKKQWQLSWILDTHPHADHFSASAWLARQTGAPMAISEKIADVQALWKTVYHLPSLPTPHAIWDVLFKDGDIFYVGNLHGEAILSPGHTPASMTYHIGNCAFIHDTLFMPDGGTARTDFPGGSAGALWDSLQRILQMPPDTRLFTGHDYRPGGRKPLCESTIQAQRDTNPWLATLSKAEFITKRRQRDTTLPLPDQMLLALQININGGNLPPPEEDGHRYLKIPLNRF